MEQLGRVIGDNVKRLRSDGGLSLDALAKLSGVSKSRLGQIERGEANPSITTVWQIANALRVEFSALVTSPQPESLLVDPAEVEPITADDGRYRVYTLFPFDAALGFEVYRSELDVDGHFHSEPHGRGTMEMAILFSGRLSVQAAEEERELGPGQAIRFRADAPHGYRNIGGETAVFNTIVAYPPTR